MNLYHCLIELRSEARALAFASAVGAWMDYLTAQGLVTQWRLLRRKFGLSSGAHSDFLLEIELPDLATLDTAFTMLAAADEQARRRYDLMHQMIADVQIGLYRPYPDRMQQERIALI